MEKRSTEEESTAEGGDMGEGDSCTVIKGLREGIYICLNYVRLDQAWV